jgi:DNA polymerase II large subunit
MDVDESMSLEFYRKSRELLDPPNFKVGMVRDHLGKNTQYDGFGFTHDTTSIDEGVLQSNYITLSSMEEKVNAQLGLGKKIRAVNEKDEAKRLLDSHFLRDIYGNLRAFGEQKFRCVKCNAKYRRVPLVGKCLKCGGKVILTVAEGSVRKYLEVSQRIALSYGLSDYMNQRLRLVENDIDSVFIDENPKQQALTEFI